MTGRVATVTILSVEKTQAYPLDAARTDGWFDRLGEDSPGFAELCDAIGRHFVAFSIIAGVRIVAVALDPRSADTTFVDFTLADDPTEHRLSLSELRRRLVGTLTAATPAGPPLGSQPSIEDLQAFIGFRYILLAAVFEIELLALHAGGPFAPEIEVRIDGRQELFEVELFRQIIKQKVREEHEKTRSAAPFSVDLELVEQAETLSREGQWAEVTELLGSWPGPLSMFYRTAEGQRLAPETRSAIARGLGLLGTAYGHLERYEWAEEVIRLGIQWAQDGPAGGGLFCRLGEICVWRDRTGEAIGLLRRASGLGVADQDVMPLLARSFLGRGRFVAAGICAERAIAAGVAEAKLEDVRAKVIEVLGESWQLQQARLRGAVV